MYTIEDNDEFLYFGGREANPIFDNIGEATTQLLENQNYKPSEEGIKAVVASVQSGATLKVKLSDLELKGDNEEWRYFEINTADYDSLNKSQRALAERVYGQGNDFVENMKMLNEEDISTAKIYVLNPEYVKKNIEAGKALARACWLYNFGGISSFDANGRSVDNANNSLRGIAQQPETFKMGNRDLWTELCSYDNLYLAYKNARKHKTTKDYILEFEKNLKDNLLLLRSELLLHSYNPMPLVSFIIRDPKTRKISKSNFRDRVIHHALCNVIEQIYDKGFIYGSYANRKGKGTLKALERFDIFKRKASHNTYHSINSSFCPAF